MKYLLVLFAFLTLPILAAEFPDGAWNGKLWDKEKLIEAAESGDKDAMAEFAYCSQMSLLGIPYDPGKIAGYSDIASRGGSTLGMVVFAEVLSHGYGFIMDQKRGLELLRKASDAGHPHAMALLADYTLTASFPTIDCGGTFLPWIEPDVLGAMKLLTNAEAGGAIHGLFVRYRIARHGLGAPVNMESATRLLIQYVEESNSAEYAGLLRHAINRPLRGITELIPKEAREKHEARLNEAAALGNPEALYRTGWAETVDANSNIGVPTTIRSANLGAVRALYSMTSWTRWGIYDSRIGAYSIAGDITTVRTMANALYVNGFGLLDNFIAINHAAYLREKDVKESGETRLDDKAIKIYRGIIAREPDSDEAYMELSLHFFYVKADGEAAKELSKRWAALYAYRVSSSDYALHCLAWFMRDREILGGKFRAPVRAVAALEYAVTQSNGHWLATQKEWLDAERGTLTDAQKDEVRKLIDEGYPHAPKFRREAFEILKKAGDIPADSKFEAFYQASPPQMMLCVAETIPETQKLIADFLDGKSPKGDDVKALTALLLSPTADLKKLLQKQDGDHAGKATHALEIIEGETAIMKKAEPVGIGVGWYLIYEKGETTAIPLVNRLEKGSPAAQAGLFFADVIESCNGVSLKGADARNRFVRLLRLWPKDLPLELDIRRSTVQPTKMDYASPKTVELTITLNQDATLD